MIIRTKSTMQNLVLDYEGPKMDLCMDQGKESGAKTGSIEERNQEQTPPTKTPNPTLNTLLLLIHPPNTHVLPYRRLESARLLRLLQAIAEMLYGLTWLLMPEGVSC